MPAGRIVEIASHVARQVLHVKTDGECEELYYGPFKIVKEASRYSARDNKDMIAISKLRTLRAALDAGGDEAAEIVAEMMPADPIPPKSDTEE